ncbi:hypothetical protein [Amycolatopsis sp. SID8362]|uniref:hypothetical protein n=1 Tax=Amycolatopsis sp. SID8362 TaxID=2690346 RepID=UPI00136ED920|nr:hypothetical protein [Amycolatopsis sp. SID8362]NBH02335.1 hypothetical protein [Amycolatopsis sp. SID8362]NED39038.1 hypothetical protein [Amycolatopsis sp. SID8362]
MHGRPAVSDGSVTSVDALSRIQAWTVTGARGRWLTAERVLELGGRRWVVGLTPVTDGGPVALVLWCGEDVVAHRRGNEAEVCGIAARWVWNLQSGRAWDEG